MERDPGPSDGDQGPSDEIKGPLERGLRVVLSDGGQELLERGPEPFERDRGASNQGQQTLETGPGPSETYQWLSGED